MPVRMILYSLTLLSFLSISSVVAFFGDSNLPPLVPQVRYFILALLAALFWVYALVVHQAWKNNVLIQWIIFVGFVAAILCAMDPVFSGDVMEYLIRGRILYVHHLNPYTTAPMDVPHDLLRPYSVWLRNPDAYGPVHVLIQTIPVILQENSIRGMMWVYKFIDLLFAFLSIYYMKKIVDFTKMQDSKRRWAIYAFNPLLIFSAAIDGRNDVIMTALLVVSVYYLLKRSYSVSIVFWALAFLIKYMVILVLPVYVIVIFAWSKGEGRGLALQRIGMLLTLAFAIIVLFFYPFWSGPETFKTIGGLLSIFYNNTFPYMFYKLFSLFGVELDAEGVKLLFQGLFLLGYGVVLFRLMRRKTISYVDIFLPIGLIFCLYYLSMCSPFVYWYMLWALPWLCLMRLPFHQLFIHLYSGIALLSFYKRINYLFLIAAVIYMTCIFVSWYTHRGLKKSNI